MTTVLAGTLKVGDEFRILEPFALYHFRVRTIGPTAIIADRLDIPGEESSIAPNYPVTIGGMLE